MTKLPTLFKRTSTGAIQQWEIRLDVHPDGTATVVTVHGQVNGAKQMAQDHIKEGKNVGKKNETTPLQQATKEMQAKHAKQLERRLYGLTVEESDIKRAAAPMLAHKYQDHADKVDWSETKLIRVQPKFDGHRCLAFCKSTGDVKLLGRTGVSIDTCEHIQAQLGSVMSPSEIFDGELYIHGTPLNKISSAIKKKKDLSADLKFVIYDLVQKDRPFVKRHATLRRVLGHARGSHLELAETECISSVEAVGDYLATCIEGQYEGAMLRHSSVGYESGKRSHSLLKLKTFEDAEFTIVSCRAGRGTFDGMAIFGCVTEDGNPFDVLAHGTHEDKRAAWANRKSHMGRQLTVKYQGFTSTDNPVPQFPIAKCFADDK